MRSWVIVISLASGLAGCASALKDLNKPAPVVSSTTLTSAQADLNRPQPTPGSSTLNAAELNKPAAKPKVSIPKPEAIAKDLNKPQSTTAAADPQKGVQKAADDWNKPQPVIQSGPSTPAPAPSPSSSSSSAKPASSTKS